MSRRKNNVRDEETTRDEISNERRRLTDSDVTYHSLLRNFFKNSNYGIEAIPVQAIVSGTEEQMENPHILEPRETIQAVAWMDMMFNDSRHTMERANEAATIIQSAFRGYRVRAQRNQERVRKDGGSSQSMVVEAILDNLRGMIWKKVKSFDKYPEEYGTREEMEETADKIQTEYKNRQRKMKISEQFEQDVSEEEQLSVNEISKIENARDSDIEEVQDVDAAQDFSDGAEIIPQEVEEASHHFGELESSPAEPVIEEKTDLKQHVQEPEEQVKHEEEFPPIRKPEAEDEHVEHKEHEKSSPIE